MITRAIVFSTYVVVFVILGALGANRYIANFNANNWVQVTPDLAAFIYCFPIVYGLVHMIPSFIAAARKSEKINLVYGLNVVQIIPAAIWFTFCAVVGLHLYSLITLVLGGVALRIAITSKKVDPNSVKINTNSDTPSASEEITKLAELREKGILSEEEFNEQKKALLNS